jgi:glutamate carboxypeptidase
MTTAAPETIKEDAENHRDDLLELCRELVNIETPSDDPDTFEPAFDRLRSRLESLRFHVRHIPGRDTGGHLMARPEPRDRDRDCQLVLGHVDTVWDVGTLEESPFEIGEDGRASGPGLFDMKAGLAQLVVALKIIRERSIDCPMSPVIFINSDEEIGSPESSRYIDCLARLARRCFVLEPAMGPEGQVKTARKGVGHFTVTISGRASHAGISPEEGSSAILELSHVIQALNDLNDPEEGITVNVGVIEGGTRSNVVAPESRAEVDVRVRNNHQAERVERAVRNLKPEAEGVELNVEGGFRRPPMEFSERNQKLWARIKDQGEAMGLDLDHTTSGGASDGNTASQHTATVDGLGPVGDGAHESYEYIEIDKLVERTALLVLLLTMEPIQ